MNSNNRQKVIHLTLDLEDPGGPGSDFELNSEKQNDTGSQTPPIPDASVERDL